MTSSSALERGGQDRPARRATRRGNHEGTRAQRADGRFVNAVRLGGRRRYFYGRSQPEADRKARAARAEFEGGADLSGGDQLLGDYLLTWLDQVVRHRRPNTYTNYEVAVRLHIVPRPPDHPLGKLRLSQIRPQHIEAWIADRRPAMVPTTLSRMVAILSAAMNRAVRGDLILRNPVSRVDPIHVDEDEVRPLSAAAARAILSATRGQVDHALYAIALSNGLRLGELLGLRWADIDMEARQLRVRSQMQQGKPSPLKQTGHRRSLTLSPWLVIVLREHADLLMIRRQAAGQKWRECGLVFPTEHGTPQRAGNMWQSWQQLLKRLDMQPTKFHNLRHTAASLALEAGVPLWKVSRMLGHKNVAVTFRVYSHLSPEGQEDIAERMEGILSPRVRLLPDSDSEVA